MQFRKYNELTSEWDIVREQALLGDYYTVRDNPIWYCLWQGEHRIPFAKALEIISPRLNEVAERRRIAILEATGSRGLGNFHPNQHQRDKTPLH